MRVTAVAASVQMDFLYRMFICACVTVSTFPSNKLFHFIWGDTPSQPVSHTHIDDHLRERYTKRQNDRRYEKYLWQEESTRIRIASGEHYRYTTSTLRKMVKQIETAFLVCLMMPFSNRHISAAIVYNRNWTFSFSNFSLTFCFSIVFVTETIRNETQNKIEKRNL